MGHEIGQNEKKNEQESDMNSDKKKTDKNFFDPFSPLSWGLEQALFYPQNSPHISDHHP